ncbi:hypothetical protein ScPMuIL_009038 [Solemya velum]
MIVFDQRRLPLDDGSDELANELEYLISDMDDGQPQFADQFYQLPARIEPLFCQKHKYPILRIIMSVLVLVGSCGVFIGMGCYSLFVLKPTPVIDKSYNAFTILNHKASENFDALSLAVKYNQSKFFRVRRSAQNHFSYPNTIQETEQDFLYDQKKSITKRSSGSADYTQSYNVWKMQVIFLAKGGDANIFTKERIRSIHEIEQKIRQHKHYPNFCYRDLSIIGKDPAVDSCNGCAPLNSLLTYFYPSQDSSGQLHYDGFGSNMANIDSAVNMAMTHSGFYYYVDEKANKSNHRSSLLRTEVLFGFPLKGYKDIGASRSQQTELFKDFVITYIDLFSKLSTSQIEVLYGGKEIFDYEVDTTFWNDIKLAAFVLGAVVVFMLVLSFSVWLMFWGTLSIILSFPLALFFYRVVFGIQTLGILNGAAAFVIIGIGVDDVFVFINIFRQSKHLKSSIAKVIHTVKTAGKATFFTSFTTAAAFAANMASSIPAIHQFGLFMSLIVSSCWITVMLIMPPALYLWSLTFARCERRILDSLCGCLPWKKRQHSLPRDVSKFICGDKPVDDGRSEAARSFDNVEEDLDVPMLSIYDTADYIDPNGDDDVPMLIPDPNVNQLDQPTEEPISSDGLMLQSILYKYLALPVIKARWIILGVSTVLLCVSVGLMTQLKPSSKPPQLFQEDTNLQRMLNLKAKLSMIDTLKCPRCSAMYSLKPEEQPQISQRSQVHTTPPDPVKLQTTGKPKPTPKTTVGTPPVTKRTYNPPVSHQYLPSTPVSIQPAETEKITDTPKVSFPVPFPVPSTTLPKITPKTSSTSTHQSHKSPDAGTPDHHPDSPTPQSAPKNLDLCSNHNCKDIKERPLLKSGTDVHVVFGIKGIDRSQLHAEHVVEEFRGTTVFDEKFSTYFKFNKNFLDGLNVLCRICKLIASNSELVLNGSADCIPQEFQAFTARMPDECKNLPVQKKAANRQLQLHLKAVGGSTFDRSGVLWLAFAFESTTSKADSYFSAYGDYRKWEKFINHIRDTELKPDSPLYSMFQTSEFWTKVMMEVVAVSSAIYGLVLSLVICVIAVAVFTGHVVLLLVVLITILKMICMVVGIFYIAGWEMGGVEAVSLSILVGSSVDYCVHLVESYQLASKALPSNLKGDAKKARQWRTSAAVTHIGVSVLSSAFTTIIAAIPLTQTKIQPFRKFGQILALNTTVSIIYAVTVCSSLLSSFAPAFFSATWKSTLKISVATFTVVGLVILTFFVLSTQGIMVPGPNGEPLFSH